jgi:hypothetical protein
MLISIAAEPLATTDHRRARGWIFLSFASFTTFNKIASALPLVLCNQKELLTAASLTVFSGPGNVVLRWS